jgi:endonuclease G
LLTPNHPTIELQRNGFRPFKTVNLKLLMQKQLKNILLPLLLLLHLQKGIAQRIDTVIQKPAYTSYYSYSVKSPLYVVYYLYKGGGDCSRKQLSFTKEYRSASNKDYAKSGYDRGHLANAEDFAFDCTMEKCTFSYYNCIPQHQKLNRGSWKSWETTIRKESQRDRLKIYTGAIYGKQTIGSGVGVPDYCWKIVYNTRTKLIMHALLFKNDASEAVQRITTKQLSAMLKYPIVFNAN